MKKPIISLIAAVSFGVALLATTLAAPFSTVRIRAEIPFDFMVGKKRLPKGEYLIESLNDSGTLTIRHAKKGKAATFNTIRHKPTDSNKSKLVFNRYGDKYFLSQVARGHGNGVMQLPTSKLEKEVQIAANQGVPAKKVVVAVK